MRGTSHQQIESLVVLSPEDLVPQEHPIRRIKPLADRVLQELSPTFSGMYAKGGGPSVPPEHLLEASLLTSLQTRMIKTGGRLVRHARRLVFQLAEVLMSREMLCGILERIGRLRLAPG